MRSCARLGGSLRPHSKQVSFLRPAGRLHMATPAAAADTAPSPQDPIVQYVVLRKDLWAEQGWPLGSVVAQACHASSAAMWLHRDDEFTAAYCSPENIDHMHKVGRPLATHCSRSRGPSPPPPFVRALSSTGRSHDGALSSSGRSNH